MCGIAGSIGTPINKAWLHQAVSALRHRGPDDAGVQTWDAPEGRGVGFAHTRLAIIDLRDAASQPMCTADRRYHLVYNGEIYNYVELRSELVDLGTRFRTNSDTEVVLEALRAWGSAALNRFSGMFALAFYDVANQTVLLARDPYGMKPLYYAAATGRTVFASEIGTILSAEGVTRKVDAAAVHDFLRFGLTDHRDDTWFHDIKRLPAGCYAVIPVSRPGAFEAVRYRVEPDAEQPGDPVGTVRDRICTLRELFLDSVRLHLRSDVPVGAALSGGIDSSGVVGAMAALVGGGAEMHAFTFSSQEQSTNELGWAQAVVDRIHAFHHIVTPADGALDRDLDQIILRQGEPFPTLSAYGQWLIFQSAQEAGVTVLLDGQGADELFGGYRPFLTASIAEDIRCGNVRAVMRSLRTYSRLPDIGSTNALVVRSVLQALPLVPQQSIARLRRAPTMVARTWFKERCSTPARRPGGARGTLREAMEEATRTTVLPSLLRFEDRNAMAFSRESRLPFLNPELASFARTIPKNELLGPDGRGKWILRRALRGLVPDDVLRRSDKLGFVTPDATWLRTLGPRLQTLIGEELSRVPALQAAAVIEATEAFLDGDVGRVRDVWRALCVVRWSALHEVEWV